MIILINTFCSRDEIYILQLTLLSIPDYLVFISLIFTVGKTNKRLFFFIYNLTKRKTFFFLFLLPKMVLSVWRGPTSSFWLLFRCPAFCLVHRESSAIDTDFSGPLLWCQFDSHCWWPWSLPLCLVVRSPHSALCFLVHWSSWKWDNGAGTGMKKPSVSSLLH